jgi:hypothetical protein
MAGGWVLVVSLARTWKKGSPYASVSMVVVRKVLHVAQLKISLLIWTPYTQFLTKKRRIR